MGYNAEAKLVVGFDIGCPEDGDEAPDWLLKHAVRDPEDGEEWEPNVCDVPVDRLLGNEVGVKGQAALHTYGYHDMRHYIIGVRVAWAIDFTSAEVSPVELAEGYQGWHAKAREALDKLGAPDTAKIGMYLCPSDG
jgi:hypothetical protein